jgi:phage tail sheath gpL-like
MHRSATPVRPTISLSIGLQAGGTGSAIGVNERTSSVALSLSGTPVIGETWSVTLGSTTYSVLAGASINLGSGVVVVDTLAELAQALAQAIAVSSTSTFSATAVGNVLVIVDNAGGAFPAGFGVQVRAAGQASAPAGMVAAGGSLTVTLSGAVIRR